MPLADFEDLLKQAIGLDAASIGSVSVERAVHHRMAAVGLSEMEDYLRLAQSSNHELQELVETVVVPETWFFRDREAFASLAHLMIDEWQPANPSATLRLLSIPCCTGEEPYSMIMALADGGLSPSRLHVDAVDVSSQALALAKLGIYGANSFRGESLSFRERYFNRVENGYAVSPSIKSRVKFRRANLLSSNLKFEELYDVIFCRNLLIYFDRTRQEQAMKILASLLTPSGLLFVGSAEAFLAGCSGFTSVNRPMSFAFRKAQAKRPEPVSLSVAAPRKHVESRLRVRGPISVRAPTSPSPAPACLPPNSELETARRLADSGQLTEASEYCEDHLRQKGPSSDAYFLLGLIKDAAGDPQTAAQCYRKVVYMEPEHIEGLLHLALLVECQGDAIAAEHLRARARRIESNRSSQ